MREKVQRGQWLQVYDRSEVIIVIEVNVAVKLVNYLIDDAYDEIFTADIRYLSSRVKRRSLPL